MPQDRRVDPTVDQKHIQKVYRADDRSPLEHRHGLRPSARYGRGQSGRVRSSARFVEKQGRTFVLDGRRDGTGYGRYVARRGCGGICP